MQVGGQPAEQRRNSTSDRLKPGPVLTSPVTFHYEIQNHTTRMQKLTKAFKVYRLMALTVICVLAGIIIGLMCRPKALRWSERQFMYIELPGELYLRFLKLVIIPLLVSNVILAFGTIQGKISTKLAKAAGLLYLACNFIAIVLAISLALLMYPGGGGARSDTNLANPNSLDTHPHYHHYLNRHRHYNSQQNSQQQQQHDSDATTTTNNNNNLFQDQQDSIDRYREYHPMFYHTNPDRMQHPEMQAAAEMLIRSDGPRQKSPTDDDATRLRQGPPRAQIHSGLQQQQQPCEQQHNMPGREKSQVALVGAGPTPEWVSSTTDGNRIGLRSKLPIDVILDALRNMIPDSLVGATMQQSRTRLVTPKDLRINRNGSTDPPPSEWLMGHEMVNQPNVIGLLAISVMTGVVLGQMGEASKPMLDLCSCVSELSLRIGMIAIHTAPICIMFLLIGQIARARDLSLMAGELLMFVITVLTALALHSVIILPLIYYLVTKKSPLRFFRGLLQALVASFATSSSSSTMALVLNCLSELDLNLVIVRAFGPLGSVFNMNGTSIFESVAVIFISQTLGMKLSLTSLFLVGFCSAIASLSTAGIPSSGMMTMVIVLNAINLPVLELSIIYIVDFIIDRFRTVVNVWSGAIVCGLIDHLCPEELFEEEMEPEKYREMIKYRCSRGSVTGRKSGPIEDKPQVISVTITPPADLVNENERAS